MKKNTKIGVFVALMLLGLLVIGAVSFAGGTKDSAGCSMGQCESKTTATKDGFQITMSYKDSSAKADAKKAINECSETIKQNYPDAKVSIKETKGGYVLSATGKSLKQAYGSAHSSKAMGGEGKVGDTSAKADESGCKMMSSHTGTEGSCDMTKDSKAMGGEGKVCPSTDSKSSGKTCPVTDTKEKAKQPTS